MPKSENKQFIDHQFKNKKFYFPNWEIKYLLVGTFNPKEGEQVTYYYGRKRNKTWSLISEIFKDKFDPDLDNFFDKLIQHKIACVDIIDQIIVPVSRIENIVGKGYKDSEIINKSITRLYNTEKILELIKKNEGVKVFSTWGTGPRLKEWINEIHKLGEIYTLISPSMAARVPKGEKKYDYMLADWNKKFNT